MSILKQVGLTAGVLACVLVLSVMARGDGFGDAGGAFTTEPAATGPATGPSAGAEMPATTMATSSPAMTAGWLRENALDGLKIGTGTIGIKVEIWRDGMPGPGKKGAGGMMVTVHLTPADAELLLDRVYLLNGDDVWNGGLETRDADFYSGGGPTWEVNTVDVVVRFHDAAGRAVFIKELGVAVQMAM